MNVLICGGIGDHRTSTRLVVSFLDELQNLQPLEVIAHSVITGVDLSVCSYALNSVLATYDVVVFVKDNPDYPDHGLSYAAGAVQSFGIPCGLICCSYDNSQTCVRDVVHYDTSNVKSWLASFFNHLYR